MIIELVHRLVPNQIKQFLKPYFRTIFPNKLMGMIWITFRCNYKCSFCPYCGADDYSKTFPKSVERTGKEWIEALNKMPATSFYIAGGEPFLYADLPYIINNLPSKHSILGIVSNGSLPLDVYFKVNKKLNLNISYHSEFVKDKDEFVKKVVALKERFKVCVNIVATPDNFDFIKNKLKIFDENNIPYHVDPLVVDSKPYEYSPEYLEVLKKYIKKDRTFDVDDEKLYNSLKKCSAGRNYYNLMPNGDATICSRCKDFLYSPSIEHIDNEVFKLGNIFNGDFHLNKKDFMCEYDCVDHCDWDYSKIKVLKSLNK